MSKKWARLISAMETRGLSQEQLSQITGICASNISHYVQGDRAPSFESLNKLLDALNCSSDYLLGLSDHITPNVTIEAVLADIDFISDTHEQDVSRQVDRLRSFILQTQKQLLLTRKK